MFSAMNLICISSEICPTALSGNSTAAFYNCKYLLENNLSNKFLVLYQIDDKSYSTYPHLTQTDCVDMNSFVRINQTHQTAAPPSGRLTHYDPPRDTFHSAPHSAFQMRSRRVGPGSTQPEVHRWRKIHFLMIAVIDVVFVKPTLF